MIFYLSCTGNTRYVAAHLAQALGESLVNVAEVWQQGLQEWRLSKDEVVGFCFPVHGWRPPLLIRRWMRELRLIPAEQSGHYSFAVCTAGDTTGETFDIFRADLREKGWNLDAMFSLRLPNTYVGLPFMDVDERERAQSKWNETTAVLPKIVCDIKERKSGTFDPLRGRWPRINSRLLGKWFVESLVTDEPFRADADLCSHCGHCAKVCPVQNIVMSEEGLPQWQHRDDCLTCFACYHGCPQKAVAFGSRTKGKGQYRANEFQKDL